MVPLATPDFSGLWRLNIEASTLRGPAPSEMLVRIRHREPTVIETVLVVDAAGEREQTLTFETSGRESTQIFAGGGGHTRAHWRGTELVIYSLLITGNRTLHFEDHWSLSADGQTLRMMHVNDDLAGQVAICEKAPPDVAARFKS